MFNPFQNEEVLGSTGFAYVDFYSLLYHVYNVDIVYFNRNHGPPSTVWTGVKFALIAPSPDHHRLG